MTVKVPLVLVLWQDKNFGGSKRVFVSDDGNLSGSQHASNVDFNDKASAVGLHPGPDFNAGAGLTVSLFSDAQFKGKELVIEAGIYPNLEDVDFNDCISSVIFNAPGYKQAGLYVGGKLQLGVQPAGIAATIAPIPAIVQLYVAHTYQEGGPGSPTFEIYRIATIVESSLDIGADYGSQFSGSAKFAKIFPGPNSSAIVRLYREPNPDSSMGHLQGGGHIDLIARPGTVGLDDFTGIYGLADYGFAHQTKAIKIEGRALQSGKKNQEFREPQ